MTKGQRKACKNLIEALRSGKYRKTEGSLCRGKLDDVSYCYCVQGLAYRLIGYEENNQLGLELKKRDKLAVAIPYADGFGLAKSSLELIASYGLSRFEWVVLLNLNDRPGTTFNDVANKLEEIVNSHV